MAYRDEPRRESTLSRVAKTAGKVAAVGALGVGAGYLRGRFRLGDRSAGLAGPKNVVKAGFGAFKTDAKGAFNALRNKLSGKPADPFSSVPKNPRVRPSAPDPFSGVPTPGSADPFRGVDTTAPKTPRDSFAGVSEIPRSGPFDGLDMTPARPGPKDPFSGISPPRPTSGGSPRPSSSVPSASYQNVGSRSAAEYLAQRRGQKPRYRFSEKFSKTQVVALNAKLSKVEFAQRDEDHTVRNAAGLAAAGAAAYGGASYLRGRAMQDKILGKHSPGGFAAAKGAMRQGHRANVASVSTAVDQLRNAFGSAAGKLAATAGTPTKWKLRPS